MTDQSGEVSMKDRRGLRSTNHLSQFMLVVAIHPARFACHLIGYSHVAPRVQYSEEQLCIRIPEVSSLSEVRHCTRDAWLVDLRPPYQRTGLDSDARLRTSPSQIISPKVAIAAA